MFAMRKLQLAISKFLKAKKEVLFSGHDFEPILILLIQIELMFHIPCGLSLSTFLVFLPALLYEVRCFEDFSRTLNHS